MGLHIVSGGAGYFPSTDCCRCTIGKSLLARSLHPLVGSARAKQPNFQNAKISHNARRNASGGNTLAQRSS